MNSTPTFAKEVVLRGRINVELLPNRDWRKLAVKGIRSMSYRVSGDAEIAGEIRHVNVHVPALNSGEICGLGKAVPQNGKDGAKVEFITGLCPKNGGLDTVKVKEVDGASVVGGDGLPVYDEAPLADAPDFPLVFGTHFFCPCHGGLTLRVTDAQIAASDRAAPDGTPYLDVRGLAHEVVPARGDRAAGAPILKFQPSKQAARKTKEAAPAPAETAAIRM